MQFSISKSALCQALTLASRVVEKRSTIPILSNVKMLADADGLTITATDLDVALSVRVEAKVNAPGICTLPAKKLADYSRLLAEGDVHFKVGETAWATITAGGSRTRIAGMSAEAFPEMPVVPEDALNVPGTMLLSLVNRAKIAISAEESRFTLNGAMFDHREDQLRIVATDGHRLAFACAELPSPKPAKFILPSTAIKNLAHLAIGAEPFAIGVDENHLFFRIGNSILTARKLVGNFPDYQRVLPKESKFVITANRAELASAISRVVQFADERSRALRLIFREGSMEVFASTVESGESADAVPCDYAGEEMQVGFNGAYVLEFLSVIDTETVAIHMNDGKSAGEFRAGGSDQYRYVVMPMRI
jgi:DNA polymerase III subunit beta